MSTNYVAFDFLSSDTQEELVSLIQSNNLMKLKQAITSYETDYILVTYWGGEKVGSSFQTPFSSLEEIKTFLKGKVLIDEYGEKVENVEEFLNELSTYKGQVFNM